jgi:hypothetical protein
VRHLRDDSSHCFLKYIKPLPGCFSEQRAQQKVDGISGGGVWEKVDEVHLRQLDILSASSLLLLDLPGSSCLEVYQALRPAMGLCCPKKILTDPENRFSKGFPEVLMTF